MAKKNFKTNPVMNFISAQEEPENPGKAPAGYKLNPLYIETKSRRVQILLQPSIYEAVKEKAAAEGMSVNEAISQALKQYVKE